MNQNQPLNHDQLLAEQSASQQSSDTANFSYQNSLQNDQSHKVWKHKFFWPLVIVMVAAVFFGGRYIYQNILSGVGYELPDWLAEQLSPLEQEVSLEELKTRDTDQDGLNDYQEIYQFGTSIFLEDSDSDGVSDFAEISSGADALCPTGQDCSLLKLITPDTKLGDVIRDVQLDPTLTIEQAALMEFRNFLVESGMTQAEVDQLTDDDLIAVFSAIDESQPDQGVGLDAEATPAEVKEFLLAQPGADTEQINSMSDEQLLQIRDTLINLGTN